jgi:membrane protease YdiL (CAAX protease family)
MGWVAGPVVLALLLGLNVGYHRLIRNYVQFPSWAVEHSESFSPWIILIFCLQPGIIEELFFRYLAQGTLSRMMGVHGAVWVAAIMFGMAHTFVPLSIPILTVVGAGLGYVRVWSGSIVLPMLLHALHNAVVLWLEQVL